MEKRKSSKLGASLSTAVDGDSPHGRASGILDTKAVSIGITIYTGVDGFMARVARSSHSFCLFLFSGGMSFKAALHGIDSTGQSHPKYRILVQQYDGGRCIYGRCK